MSNVGEGPKDVRVRARTDVLHMENDRGLSTPFPPHPAASDRVIMSPERVKTPHHWEPRPALFPSEISSKKGTEGKKE